jgi:cysteine desulfurase / selenocysteine lyase
MNEPQEPNSTKRIYLDHAATSWPKCPAAVEAAFQFIQQCGATSGRGSYRSAQTADRWLADARLHLRKVVNAPTANCIAFCSSGTHALNAALYGLLNAGDHVITTAIEHNSVLRPLAQLVHSRGIALEIANCDAVGFVATDRIAELVRTNTKLIAIGHASNVTGTTQPIAAVSEIARNVGAILLVDASQTLGYLPIDMQTLGIDVLAAAGHKGLRAIAGTAFLAVVPRLHSSIKPLMQGGTGHQSESIEAQPSWPQSVEVGNLNLPGIVSMAVAAKNMDTRRPWLNALRHLREGLQSIAGVKVYGLDLSDETIPVLSITVEGWDIHDLANVLDANFGIEVRAGLHCAALVHNFIGSIASGGTVRLSLGHGTDWQDVESTLSAFRKLLG